MSHWGWRGHYWSTALWNRIQRIHHKQDAYSKHGVYYVSQENSLSWESCSQHRAPAQVPPTKSFPYKSQSGLKLGGHRLPENGSKICQAKLVASTKLAGWQQLWAGLQNSSQSFLFSASKVYPSKCILMRKDGTNSM